MSKVIRIKYENGVLKPLDKIELREGRNYGLCCSPGSFLSF